MGWVRLDDNFADHPKVIALSDTAFRLFVTGLCYSNRHLTDGLVPYQMVNAWVGDDPMKPSDELEDQNLWERVDKGFLIRSYDEYQPTRDSVEAKRQQPPSGPAISALQAPAAPILGRLETSTKLLADFFQGEVIESSEIDAVETPGEDGPYPEAQMGTIQFS